MSLFNIRHAECDAVGEGDFVEAKDAKTALMVSNPMFRYYAGDADSWSGIETHLRHLKPVSGQRPSDIAPGTEPYMASADKTPDYFWVYQVTKLPDGKELKKG